MVGGWRCWCIYPHSRIECDAESSPLPRRAKYTTVFQTGTNEAPTYGRFAPDIGVLEANVACYSSKIEPPHKRCRVLDLSRERGWEMGVAEKRGICDVV